MATPVVALELFSGIGGLRFALEGAAEGVAQGRVSTVAAFDVNEVANATYEHNFGDRPCQRSCESLTADDLEKFGATIWLMSPPCQPYSRNGHRKGSGDARAEGFLSLMDELQKMRPNLQPQGLLLENVVGFEASQTSVLLEEVLQACGYHIQDFVLTPTQYGVPYSRPRYFLLASKKPFPQPATSMGRPCTCSPARLLQSAGCEPCSSEAMSVRPLSDYLCEDHGSRPDSSSATGDPPSLAVPLRMLRGSMDITTAGAGRCCCFTKGYGRYIRGTGSLLATCAGAEDQLSALGIPGSWQTPPWAANGEGPASAGDAQQIPYHTPDTLSALKLRFFSPREIANLHGFPPSFSFPEVCHVRKQASAGMAVCLAVHRAVFAVRRR